ncbi:MAG: carbonic anhydrase [Deltaproteobacteria bacterium]|nr:carbonic anhydrase [Myxococcales bacterium]MDP3214533.1 carbonic anhydrase [Deltaproteobacteria bacterium]
MKKLINGILEFRQKAGPEVRETFTRLALGQSPDCLFIACSDSRVVPNLFASTYPGDLFVLRNVGNLMPPSDTAGRSLGDESEASAVEFAVATLNVKDVVVCGHSECGAMKALLGGRDIDGAPNLSSWLRHGDGARARLEREETVGVGLAKHNQLSQLSVLEQIEHLRSYPLVQKAIAERGLRLHGWWFDIATAAVHHYEPDERRFVLIDETEGARYLAALDDRSPST